MKKLIESVLLSVIIATHTALSKQYAKNVLPFSLHFLLALPGVFPPTQYSDPCLRRLC